MRKHSRSVLAAVVCALVLSAPAVAHHGDAGRYSETVTTVRGTVVEFQFVNPHSVLIIAVEDENGELLEWHGELGSPNGLRNNWGWNKETFQVGDVITMTGRALKNGGPYMTLTEKSRMFDADGNEIYVGD